MWLWAVLMLLDLGLGTTPNLINASENRWRSLKLITEHIPYFFFNNPESRAACKEDENCPYKELLNETRCWGYEDDCPKNLRMSKVNCPGSPESWVSTKEQQEDDFWRYGDFGNVAERRSNMKTFCAPELADDSSLKCSDNTRFCTGKNIYIDLSKANLNDKTSGHYRSDTLPEKGLVGGKCKLNHKLIKENSNHKSFLQSWTDELQHFTEFDFQPIKEQKCDVVFTKPTVLFKLDAGVNMYHHFCDFVNLYMSQHINNSFSMDITIINWDTNYNGYYDGLFGETWKAFTSNPMLLLKDYAGKKLCFKDVMFPLLARQIRGLFYNTPIIPGCFGSNLFRAFSHHVLHRLDVAQNGPLESKIRVTFLVRKTSFRQILNENELKAALEKIDEIELKLIDYRALDFLDQLAITANSDVFMGIHGAGLTHFLFQPDWGASFEIYNCMDEHCYKDIARLRGTKYYTWEDEDKLIQQDEGKHPQLGAHAKFTNYTFDMEEFMRIVRKMLEHVKRHPAFKEAWQHKYKRVYLGSIKDEL